MPTIGYVSVTLAFVLACYATVVAVIGIWRNLPELIKSSRNATYGVSALLTVAIIVIEYLLIVGDYQTSYVHDVSNLAAPLFYRITALWGGQAGSLLFWSWLMSLWVSLAIYTKWQSMYKMMPYVLAITQFSLLFFIGLVVFIANPFEQLPFAPPDGQGMNPLLRHFGMIIHPPMLYMGFVSFVVPFAFAIAALITRDTGDTWIRTTRRWTLTAWMFLSIGLLLGGWWAYDVLGWGGYWGWDPVENASLIPWLVATPFLHSVMMQENRGMLKRWNMALIILTYLLVIEGTFLTRSGMLSSVHTFAESAIGPLFLGFITITFFGSFYLFVTRWDDLGSDNELDSLISRESFFLLNNLIFIGLGVVVWWGTHYPLFTEAFTGETIVVGPPFYEKTTAPLWAAIILLMGIAPLLPWRRTSMKKVSNALTIPTIAAVITMIIIVVVFGITIWGAVLGFGLCAFALATIILEYWRGVRVRHNRGESYPVALYTLIARNRRRYGGYMIHLGVILVAIGVVGSRFYQVETQQNIAVGESMSITSELLGTYTMTYHGLRDGASPDDRLVTEAVLTLEHNGQPMGELIPVREFFVVQQQPMTIPDKQITTMLSDIYIILAGWEGTGQSATFKAYINPLVNWLWIGGIVFILGTIVAAWPSPTPRRASSRQNVSLPGAVVPAK